MTVSIGVAPLVSPMIRYEQDSYGWAMQQIDLLRAERRDELDLPHLAQTLAGLVAQERAKLKAVVEQILEALLKWDQSPEPRNRAWGVTIQQQRRRVLKQIRRQPGLMAAEPEITRDAYRVARAAVTGDLELDDEALPRSCPYAWSDITRRPIAWTEVWP